MPRTPILPIALALLLTTPMAVGAASLFSPAEDTLTSPAAGEDMDTTQRLALAGYVVHKDDNHTLNVEVPLPDDDPAEVGRWLGPVDGEVPAVNLAVLSDGRVLYYSGVEARPDDQTSPTDLTFMVGDFPLHGRSRAMDLSIRPDGSLSASVTVPSPDETGGAQDLFCSATTIAPDGTVLSTGATEWHTLDEGAPDAFLTPLKGGEQTMHFHGATDAWTKGTDMQVDRWYPSALQLGDGRTLIASGIQTLAQPQTHNTLVELYDPDTGAMEAIEPELALAPGVTLGQVVPDGPETGNPSMDETHDRVPNLPMYPRLFTVPGGPFKGEVFYTTAGDLWGPFGEHPLQEVWSHLQTFDAETGTFTVHQPSAFGARQLAASVPLTVSPDDGYAPRYLTFGGTLQQGFAATTTAEVADLSTATPTAAPTGANHLPRWHVNGVLLPDGGVLAVGGGLYDNVIMHGAPEVAWLNGELYDPDRGQWSLTAPMDRARVYHSTAVLLPDGRVLAGGHVPLPAFHKAQRDELNPQVTDSTFEVYEPPYLFIDDSRPVIEAAPAAGLYGQTVTVELSNVEEALDSVVLVRPGATTHGFDADQRAVELEVVGQAVDAQSGITSVTVALPPDGDVAPPGHYMLFVNEDVDGQAFPSEATFLHLS